MLIGGTLGGLLAAIMDIAGHVSHRMLARYSHIRMAAKRKALESIVKQAGALTTGSGGRSDLSVWGKKLHF